MKTQREKYLELALRTIQTELLEAYSTLERNRNARGSSHALKSVNTAISVATNAQKGGES